MKSLLSASLLLAVCLPLSAQANSYVCEEIGTVAAGYPKQLELSAMPSGFYINGNALSPTNYMGAPLLKLDESDLLYSIHQERNGQRVLFLFDPMNTKNRAQAGMLRAVGKYICK